MPQKKRTDVPDSAGDQRQRPPTRHRATARAHARKPRTAQACLRMLPPPEHSRARRPAPWPRPTGRGSHAQGDRAARPALRRPEGPRRPPRARNVAHDVDGTASAPRAVRTSPRAKASTAVATPAAPAPAPSLAADGTARLSILMVTPEAHPFAKTGGLAEVAAALPQALAALGHAVTLVMPRYRGIDTAATRPCRSRSVWLGRISPSVLERQLPNGVRLALVDAPRCSIVTGCTATQRRLPGQRLAVRGASAARRSSTPARAEASALRDPRARLADRAGRRSTRR